MNKEVTLDAVGRRIVEFVRDDTLRGLDQLLDGTAKAPSLRNIAARLGRSSEEERTLIRDVAAWAIDNTLHNCMWLLEGGEGLELHMTEPGRAPVNISALSDGLAGELASEKGWIQSFSKYK